MGTNYSENVTKTKTRDFLKQFNVDPAFIVERNLRSFADAKNLVVADVSQSGREHELTPEAAKAWQKMKEAAHAADVSLIIVSAYRSFARQCEIVKHSLQGMDVNVGSIFLRSAPPGYSEHHTGKAIDIGTMGCEPLSKEFGKTVAFNWLFENAKDFGFRLSYPENNKYGFMYEPWHWFYQGKVELRKVTLHDLKQLRDIGIQTFSETFNKDNDSNDMQSYLDDKFSSEHLTKEINNPESEFYFAELEQQKIGYLKVNTGKAQSENLLDESLEIERIYVLKEFHGNGFGKLLFDKALEVSRQSSFKRLWLGVWEHNLKAIKFYQRQGFEKFAEHEFVLGDKVDTDWLMKLEL